MNPLRSVGVRLSIALLLVVAGALGAAYLVVVPRLQDRLVDSRVAQFNRTADRIQSDALYYYNTTPSAAFGDWAPFVRTEADQLKGRLVYLTSGPTGPRALADSDPRAWGPNQDALARRYPVAGEAILTGHFRHGNERYGEVAVRNDESGGYFVFSKSIEDTYASVNVVKRRLLLAGLVILAVALVAGFAAARMFARRIRRLERAADRIAAGHFDEPVVDTGKDELGELALAFDRMRQRLAHLEHARREFIANASHELRTPLFALAGLLELLDDEDLDEATRNEFLSTAREQSDRLTRLATDLLDLNRLDAGRLHVERETVELDELAETLANEFRAVAKAKEHPLELLTARASAVADEQRVLQIGRALVENALLHTPPGTTVRLRTRTSENGTALLVVEDDGPGIPGEHTDHVFQRFYRVNGTVTSGSGLGLAIARELAELMRGEISIASRPGLTAFTLSLPVAKVPAAAAVA
jgi:signal transduction histidine kinase